MKPGAAVAGDQAAEKTALRLQVREAIRCMSAATRESFDSTIAASICSWRGYLEAEQVLAYSALADEVNLRAVMEHAANVGKHVFLPVTDPNDWSIEFRRWNSRDRLVVGGVGVQEPPVGEAPAQVPSVVLVPGRLFSPDGSRIGRGRGCYDTVLDGLGELGPVVGVGYSCQLRPVLPQRPEDRTVDFVVSEEGLLPTKP